MVSTINKQAYIRISLCLFVFYFAWSTSWSFLAIWLADNVGLNSEKIGFVLSINALFALAMKPVCGYIMDKLGLGKHLLVIVTLASVLAAPFFIWVYQPLLGFNLIAGMLVGALYLSFAYLAGCWCLNPTPTATAAPGLLSLAACECGVRWAGR